MPRHKKPSRPQIPTVLLYCAGVSEKEYFENMREHIGRQSGVVIKVDHCNGKDPETMKAKLKRFQKNYDYVFCVIDKDDFTENQIANLREDSYVILQTPAIEFWFCLHYCGYTTSQKSTDEWIKVLRENLPDYKKGKSVYPALKPHFSSAITAGGKVKNYHLKTSGTGNNPATDIPELIAELTKLVGKKWFE